ncbi:MAG: cellulase family glycosylhydrolase [Planctomycetota bacterium]
MRAASRSIALFAGLVGLVLAPSATHAVEVSIGGEVIATVPPRFMGLHYNGPTHRAVDPDTGQLRDFASAHADPAASAALVDAGVGLSRVFVDAPQVNPAPGVYDWADIDTAVNEIVATGMTPMLTLHQRDGAWHVGDVDTPWWDDPTGLAAWTDLAATLATRYADRATYFELLNEPNHLHPTRDSYMGLDRSAELFVAGASAIRAAAPDAKIGGPASFGSWEPATWAKRVLNLPGGEAQLDFVSYHVYATGSATATDADLFERARWWETVPQAIRTELEANTTKPIELALTEFNASSVFELDGELWTDPRNVDDIGGLLAALGWLYSARGGADIAVRFGTTGGFGLIRWPPDYELRPAYHAVRLLHEVAGLVPGAELLSTTIAGEASGLEAFALRDDEGERFVLINTDDTATHTLDLVVGAPTSERSLERYRYDAGRTADALTPLSLETTVDGELTIDVPPRSLVVLAASNACRGCGDYNADGAVTDADYAVWRDQFGLTGDLSADGNADGVVNAADYTLWRDALSTPVSAVPEPTALWIALVGATAVCGNARVRSRRAAA